jgi:hypothetical protein
MRPNGLAAPFAAMNAAARRPAAVPATRSSRARVIIAPAAACGARVPNTTIRQARAATMRSASTASVLRSPSSTSAPTFWSHRARTAASGCAGSSG